MVTICQEIKNRLLLSSEKTQKSVVSMIEDIQACILFEINGFSKNDSKKYAKEYQGDLSEQIIEATCRCLYEITNKKEFRED